VGLYWGLPAKGIVGRLETFAGLLNMDYDDFLNILRYGLPAVLCYTFVERSVRFGLGVGALLLAAGFCALIHESPLFQDRSFFGVLRVEESRSYMWEIRAKNGKSFFCTTVRSRNELLSAEGSEIVGFWAYPAHSLTHGTTLHGKQLLDPGLRDLAISYYHRTGPMGHIIRAYNTDPARPLAVIGLGTGSMACYALKGQTFDFFDIDPVVVGISFDTDKFFSFVEDAEARGANMSLVLGDARLTFEPKGEKARLKPLHRRDDARPPARTFGDPVTPHQKYGLIVVDAFSSDAIPVHLITREAMKIYRERLLPDGVLCMHISNRYLTLQPVLANIVEDLGMAGVHMSDDDESSVGKTRSHWVAIAKKKEHLDKLLHPVRWKNDPAQAALLAPALFPGQATTGLPAAGSLCYALQRIVDLQQAQEEKKSGEPTVRSTWMPVSTQDRFPGRLEKARAVVTELEEKLDTAREEKDREDARKDLQSARNRVETLQKSMVAFKRVGVWTDDYSNLLSVFRLKEDYDRED
jgi:hypothetical protein